MSQVNQAAASTLALAAGFALCAIEVNKKDEATKKYVKVGEVSIHVPTLAAFGIEAEQAKDKDGKPMVEDNLPVYTTDTANWLQGAILAQVKAQARNKLVSGTADLKPGAKIATNFAELTAEGDRAGNGAALQAIRDLKLLFAKWVAGLNKSSAAQALLNSLFGNKQALAVQAEENKAKMAQYVSDFADSLTPEQLEAGQKYLQSLLDTCSTAVSADDF